MKTREFVGGYIRKELRWLRRNYPKAAGACDELAARVEKYMSDGGRIHGKRKRGLQRIASMVSAAG